jgi:hypothetical protein
MRGGLMLALALVTAGDTVFAASLTLEMRVFNGMEDVTRDTRIAVYRAGERGQPLVQLGIGHVPQTTDLPPSIYDVQAIHERDGRVVNIRWAQRLVVMPYPDEKGRHLEVINFQNGFGALEIRRKDQSIAEAALFARSDHVRPVAMPVAGSGYVVFVVRAGAYDLQTRDRTGQAWFPDIEIPLDRTRFWLVP